MREDVSIQSRVALFLSWASVAIEHEHIAHQARAGNLVTGMRTWDAGASPESHNLRHEFDASLVTVTAAALAIDALYGSLWDMVPPRDHKHASRQMRIFETLKAGFRLGKATNEWPPRLEWLFHLRNQGVHFRRSGRSLHLILAARGLPPNTLSSALRRRLRLLISCLRCWLCASRAHERPIRRSSSGPVG